MPAEIWNTILYAIGILAIFGVLGFCLIKAIKDAPRQRQEAKEQIARREQILSEDCSEMKQVIARVEDLTCQVNMVGIHTPKTEKRFLVIFQTKTEERFVFEIPEEMYHGLEVGQQGLLTYVEDCLYGFEPESQ